MSCFLLANVNRVEVVFVPGSGRLLGLDSCMCWIVCYGYEKSQSARWVGLWKRKTKGTL